jgi:hypothetical protein
VEATGRAGTGTGAPGHAEGGWPTRAFPAPGDARNYTQHFRYDALDNLEQIRHVATGGGWTFNLTHRDDGNRLDRTWFGTGASPSGAAMHRYDAHGNLLNLANTAPGLDLRYNDADLLMSVDLGGGGVASYTYGTPTARVHKRIVRQGGGTRIGSCWTATSASVGALARELSSRRSSRCTSRLRASVC